MRRVNPTRYAVASATLAGALLVGACSSGDDVSSDTASDTAATDTATFDGDAVGEPTGLGSDILARFGSCDDVAPAVAPYIEGLTLRSSSGVDEYSVYCSWETSDSATSLDEIRSVEIVLAPGSGTVPSASDLETGGLELIPDADIEAAGGIAYTMGEAVSVAAVSVTQIQLPEVEVSITGGQWGDYPSLDAPTSVTVAKELLDL
ncbi:hypothetical protein [Rhodococcus sp. B50]|uniref:hypothetical protein n=1 Tax=Rhodococcus sp. B50 TaxID=2682847 RepID=UPI0019FBFF62|nr:hypothetical protein [Rhodococcus sp. B50]MBS9372366.1 hypothetical protein [Rhodococcus sp. B50]